MRMPRLCNTHPFYKALRPPKAQCAACKKAYKRSQRIERAKDKLSKAAGALSDSLGATVIVEAKYVRPCSDERGYKVIVSPI